MITDHKTVFRMLCDGYGFEDIAVRLGISPEFVRRWWQRLPEPHQAAIVKRRRLKFLSDHGVKA